MSDHPRLCLDESAERALKDGHPLPPSPPRNGYTRKWKTAPFEVPSPELDWLIENMPFLLVRFNVIKVIPRACGLYVASAEASEEYNEWPQRPITEFAEFVLKAVDETRRADKNRSRLSPAGGAARDADASHAQG